MRSSYKSEKFWQATGQSNYYWHIQTAGRNKSFQSLVIFVLEQLHFGQQSVLPFCLPSLIDQWPAKILHFQLLYDECES